MYTIKHCILDYKGFFYFVVSKELYSLITRMYSESVFDFVRGLEYNYNIENAM